MVDVDTFLTTLAVIGAEFCQTSLPLETPPGPAAALSRRETGTLAICGQWQGFGSARGFSRDAQRHLCAAFPHLPPREQCNRQVRQHAEALVAGFLSLGRLLAAQGCPSEALDSSGLPTRDAKRRGAGGLPGVADIGWSNRLGWYEGVPLLRAVNPVGEITGFGVGPARPQEQPLADTFCALRRQPPQAGRVWAPWPVASTWATRASRDKPISAHGGATMAPRSSVRPSAIVRPHGPSDSGAGWRGDARG